MQKLDHALQLAALGFRVFPLIPNSKKPAVDEWPRKATTDQATIARYWSTHPDANIGIAGGDGLVILDVDNKNGKRGSGTLTMLELEHGDLPAGTLTSRTPTGGQHIFLKVDQDVRLRNSVGKIGHGLDLRSDGGYVVAPGSTLDGQPYEWLQGPDSGQAAPAPEWLIDLAGRASPRQERHQDTVGDLDTQWAIDQAKRYLSTAEPAVLKNGSNDHTHKLAKRVLDFGVSPEMALDLMLDHWNERCSPPWPPEKLQRMVKNAATYRENPIGSANPQAEFEPDPETAERVKAQQADAAAQELKGAKSDQPLTPQPLEPFDLSELTPPQWQWRNLVARGYVTLGIAAPGVGKTNLALALAIAKAAGRDDIVGPVYGAGPAWFISGEDSVKDLRNRIAGVMQLHNVTWADLGGRLFVNSAQDQKIQVAKLIDGKQVKAVDAKAILDGCVKNQIAILTLDPLVEFHTANENDNGQMAEVAGYIRRIAWEADTAVLVIHHTRKHDKAASTGQEGDQDSGRGARSLGGNARIVFTLAGMSEKRAKTYGVPENLRRRYIALDGAKNNLAPIGEPIWFEQTGVDLGDHGLQVGAIKTANLSALQNSDGDAASLLHMAVEGLLTTIGDGRWSTIGAAVEYVMAHDAFFAGKDETTVRKRVRAALDGAVEDGAVRLPDGREGRVERNGENTKSVRYCVILAGE